MSQLFKSIDGLRQIFVQYAGADGNSTTMTKSELAQLLRKECLLQKVTNEDAEKFLKTTMSDLNEAVSLLKKTFYKYSQKDGDPETLSKRELTELLHNELDLKACSHDEKVCKFFSTLDFDKDGVIDFKEYVISVITLGLLASQE
ncbi:hypothetical protein PFLUV_G00085310 [Xyrichtys novacula]|uniref:Protein S100 n=1 Tax=Xyrichtys novacula TaxID=13765 RepID=A0AAV1FN01_XYRNO|nr:hypothetical protein PFLUV_G00085310 [Xyrichtys novacula]